MHSLKPLTQEQRQSAYEQARKAVIRSVGEHPKQEHLTQHAMMKYPPAIRHLINLLCIILLLEYPVQELRTIRNLSTERRSGSEITIKRQNKHGRVKQIHSVTGLFCPDF